MKKKLVVVVAALALMVTSIFVLAGCGDKIVDYAEGLTPSTGLEFHHISELESGAFNFGYADYVTGEKDYYVLTGIGTCTDKDIVVPSTYEGKPVKAIGDRAFMGVKINSMTCPNSIEVLSTLAVGNTQMKSFKANGVIVYGDGAVASTSVEHMVLSQKAEIISHMALFFSPDTKSVWFPKTVKEIGPDLFLDSGYEVIYYEGSEEDWAKIKYTAGESDFKDMKVEFNVKYPGFDK